jgi:hypothetical protein
MLDQLVQERGDAWELLSSHDVRRQGEVFSQALRIYRLINWQSLPKAEVHLHTSEGGGLLQDKDAPEPLIVPGPPRIG